MPELAAPPALVDVPARIPRSFGVLSQVQFRPILDRRWESGVEWEKLSCGSGTSVIGPAWCDDAVDGLPKTFSDAGSTGTAYPFTVYGSFRCSPVGWTPENAKARALADLEAHEEKAVEGTLWSSGPLGFLDKATVVPGGDSAKPPAQALGLLDRYSANHYGSLPVLHVTVEGGHALSVAGLLDTRGLRAFTTTGMPVVIGAGYPNRSPGGVAAPAGSAWAIITPQLFGYRSYVFTSSDINGDLLDRRTNDLYAVAERTYVIGYDDCGVGAALIDLAT